MKFFPLRFFLVLFTMRCPGCKEVGMDGLAVIRRRTGMVWYLMALLAMAHGCEKEDPVSPPVPYGAVNGFVISEKGEKWLATSHGLYSLDEGSGTIESEGDQAAPSPLHDLAFSKGGASQELWLATGAGACNYTTQIWLNTANSGLQNNEVSKIHIDRDSLFYFATPEGLSVLDHQQWKLYTGLDGLFLRHEITDIAADDHGFTYLTTLGGGIERFRNEVDGISGATVFDTDWTSLMSDNIHSVFIDDTIQAFGTDGGAAIHFSEFTKRDWVIYSTKDGLINDTVLTIVRDHHKNWWFGTRQGISRLSGSQWTSYTIDNQSILDNHIKFLAVDPEGGVWAATDRGLSRFLNDRWTSFPK